MELDTNNMVNIIGNFGFPIMITLYLLMRFEKKLDALTEAIVSLQKNSKQ
ncbi:YvrJ family protein [Proteinivorax tanatarense]|uniref:YvrJ family protein n=1 Tax=Proteinivorax tanatarense TaxID=1260629 RepID=A0AAU7VN91_9FIRM